jgi:hypothetical protein
MATRFCDPSATGSNNGTSWENAYTSLQAAIDAGASTDEVWVKARSISLSATIDFDNANSIKVYGGFATDLTGTNGSVAGRTLASNITTLTRSTALKLGAITTSVLIDGFDFNNGSGTPGGANVVGTTITVTISNCKFTHNTGTYQGAALLLTSGSTINIDDCVFHGGSGVQTGAGIHSAIAGTLTVRRCTFDANNGTHEGSAFRKSGAGSAAFEDCVFSSNTITTGIYGGGGAITVSGGTTTFLRCKFTDNLCAADGWGGALKVDGSGVAARFTNCVFSGNHATYGGAILPYTGSATLTNCIVADNHSAADGGGIAAYGTTTIVNCIFWNNAADGSNDQIDNGGATPSVTYSDVQGGYTGTGNVNDDPHFLGSGGNPYNFGTTTSSAIDSGNAGATYYPTTDYLGQARVDYSTVTNNGAGTPAYSDMGAYELQEAAPPVTTTAKLLLLFN